LSTQSPTHHPISTATNSIFIADSQGSLNTLELPIQNAFASDKLHENLLSINQLSTDGFDCLFKGENVYIGKEFELPTKINVKGKKKGGSYYVTLSKSTIPLKNKFSALSARSDDPNTGSIPEVTPQVIPELITGELQDLHKGNVPLDESNAYITAPTSNKLTHIDEVHNRLGHLNENAIHYLSKHNLLGNLNLDPHSTLNPCNGCLEGKSRKGTPPTSTTKTFQIGDLVHMDICGPIEPVTSSGKRYILTATDDYSRYVHTWALRTKGEAFSVLKTFFATFENRHGSVKSIRTDNGGEFTSKKLIELCSNLGIDRQLTIRYSSHQNGISERANLTILNGIRACLSASKLDWNLWDEALNYVTKSRNVSPTVTLKQNTPSHLWHEKVPDFVAHRTFGETCFAVTPVIDRRRAGSTKLANRAQKARFLSYCTHSKGYRLLLEDGNILESTYSNTIFESPVEPLYRRQCNNSNIFVGGETIIVSEVASPNMNIESVNQIDGNPELHTSDLSVSNIYDDAQDISFDSDSNILDQSDNNDALIHMDHSGEADIANDNLPDSENSSDHHANIHHSQSFGKWKYQDSSVPAKKDRNAAPSSSKRERKPVNYSSAFQTNLRDENACTQCIGGKIAQEEIITPAAGDFLTLASLRWLKEVCSKSSRATANENNLPKNHHQVIGHPEETSWIQAEEEEIAQLIAMGTWTLVPLPPGRTAIKNTWVYRKKKDANGNVVRYKARLCACGYSQKAGIDYQEIYSPVFRMESSRLFLTILASRNMFFKQMDVSAAFLNSDMDTEIYMKQITGYEDLTKADYVLLLLRSLYGLKQSPRLWHKTIHPFLESLGFTAMEADPCIYFQWKSQKLQLISLYVDNLGIAGDLLSDVETVRRKLKERFKMTDEPENQFLGVHLRRTKEGFVLNQTNAIEDLLIATNMSNANSVSTPMESLTCSKLDCPLEKSEEWNQMQSIPYRETIGSLTNICRMTRPDISYAVSVASRYLSNPGYKHWNLVKRILKYLKGTMNYEFHLSPGSQLHSNILQNNHSTSIQGNLRFYGLADADWGGEIEESKSTSGYGFFLGNSLVSWCSKTQPLTATSSTFAEYIGCYHAASELVWSRIFLNELNLLDPGTTTLYTDNESVINIASNHVINPRSKHFNTKFHYLRQLVAQKIISLVHTPGASNIADMWTKPLGKERFCDFRSQIGVLPGANCIKVPPRSVREYMKLSNDRLT